MKTAVLICPGRGTYGAGELGYLRRFHEGNALVPQFDAVRDEAGQDAVSRLDGATGFAPGRYSRGDVASPLIYACSILDSLALSEEIEVVAVTGNSMGWYTALAAGGAVAPGDGFRIVNTMGTLMQEHLIGGQLVYPFVAEDWADAPSRKAELLELVHRINAADGQMLSLSIDLGGMLVLAGDAAGLAAFEGAVPRIAERFPMRLKNHAGFHSSLQLPVAQAGQQRLETALFNAPDVPLVDGRGAIWWPQASDPAELRAYTLGTQVVEPYDFTRAITVAAREFAPDLFVITGPGETLGGVVAQALILAGWRGMASKQDFRDRSAATPFLISMGNSAQRKLVVH